MPIVAKLDEFGKPAWILLIVLGFMFWWPIGLTVLGMAIGSGRLACGRHSSDHWQQKMDRMQGKMERFREKMGSGGPFWERPSSGNRAFDDYRNETLRRLEDEQREFKEFLGRLRMAKDKSEFDQFMAERRGHGTGGSDFPPQQS